MKKVRARYSLWQSMLSYSSGVPTADNARYLAAFLSRRGADIGRKRWIADKGGFYLEPGQSEYIFNLEQDGAVRFEGVGNSFARGIYPKVSSTDSALMVVSAKPNDAGFAEGPTIISRFGGNASGEGTWRVRTHPAGVGDQIFDDAGTLFGDTFRNLTDTKGHYILVGAIDRVGGVYKQLTWLNNNSKLHEFTMPIDTLGSISFKTHDEGSQAVSSHTFVGRFYGVGLWVFPNELPTDWAIAALFMGLAWKSGKFTFWPKWGVI